MIWTEWKTKVLQIVDKHAPIPIKRVRSKNSPWITANLKERMRNRDTLKIKAIKSNDPHDWVNFKRMRNKANTEMKAPKELFLPPQGFGPEAKTRGNTLAYPGCISYSDKEFQKVSEVSKVSEL